MNWTGTILRWTFRLRGTFDGAIAAWGDSLTAGSGSTLYHDWLTQLGLLAGRGGYNGGIGGQTSTQIAARETVDTAHRSWPTIIWAGDNNYNDPPTVEADVASMVSHLGHHNYLVLSLLNGDYPDRYIGQPGYNDIVSINDSFSAAYGSHYVDLRTYLVSKYDPNNPQDVIDHGNDIIPSSLRSDQIHLNDAGYLLVAKYINTTAIGVLEAGKP